MEIVEGIVYVFATIVMLFIGPIFMVTMPPLQEGDLRKGITEKKGFIRNIIIAIILEIGSILVLLDLWKIVEIF